MGIFYVFEIVKMVLNRTKHLMYSINPFQTNFSFSSPIKRNEKEENRLKWVKISGQATNKVILETATGVVLKKKLLLKISQYSQENTCFGVSFK